MVHERNRDSIVLDFIFSNNEDMIINLTFGEHLRDSVHNIVIFWILFEISKVDDKSLILIRPILMDKICSPREF